MSLTVVILCKNEEQRLPKALRSAGFADKVVVIDSFSDDASLDLIRDLWTHDLGRSAEDLICVVAQWEGFTATRQKSLEWITTDWVFWLDSDEWIGDDLRVELQETPMHRLGSEILYCVPRLSHFLGRPIRHGGWYPDRKFRLGRVGSIEWRSGPRGADVHEDLYPKFVENFNRKDSVYRLKGHIHHLPFRDRGEQDDTNRRYSSLLAKGLAEDWKAKDLSPPSDGYVWVKVVVKFVENYVFKLGCLDGWPGFVIALGSAKSLFWRYQKARQLCE